MTFWIETGCYGADTSNDVQNSLFFSNILSTKHQTLIVDECTCQNSQANLDIEFQK